MAITTTTIADLLIAVLDDSQVEVQGDGGKYQVFVTAQIFVGLNRVKRQQVIYRILNEHIASGAIHAVNMTLKTPEEMNSGS